MTRFLLDSKNKRSNPPTLPTGAGFSPPYIYHIPLYRSSDAKTDMMYRNQTPRNTHSSAFTKKKQKASRWLHDSLNRVNLINLSTQQLHPPKKGNSWAIIQILNFIYPYDPQRYVVAVGRKKEREELLNQTVLEGKKDSADGIRGHRMVHQSGGSFRSDNHKSHELRVKLLDVLVLDEEHDG